METVITTTVADTGLNTNDVEHYTRLINTYGASAVIIAAFMVILFAVLIFILRNNAKTNNQIINQQRDLVNMLVSMAEKGTKIEEESSKPKIVKEPNLVEMFININGSIKDTLKDVSEELDTDRVAVYVFHNGVFSSHGLPFFKISCVCEVVKKNTGVIKNLKAHSSLPLQMFDTTIVNIYRNGSMTILDSDDESNELVANSPILCGMLKTNNIRSATGIAIYDHDNNIMGILIAEYVSIKDEEFLKDATRCLTIKAPLLSPVLEYSGIYDATNN